MKITPTIETLMQDAAFNALNIAREMPAEYGREFLAANAATCWKVDRVAQAGRMLAVIESTPDWSWEEQSNDYETACAYIAKLCATQKPITVPALIACITH